MTKLWRISSNAVMVVPMIGTIPFVPNDYVLALVYILFAVILFAYKRDRSDYLAYAFGLIAITISEYFFIQTGVEKFSHRTLLGVMPIWLPLLWAFAFVIISRSLRILGQ